MTDDMKEINRKLIEASGNLVKKYADIIEENIKEICERFYVRPEQLTLNYHKDGKTIDITLQVVRPKLDVEFTYNGKVLEPEEEEFRLSWSWWWGYLDMKGSIHTKKYINPRDIESANESDFVKKIIYPFRAENEEIAKAYVAENVKDLID